MIIRKTLSATIGRILTSPLHNTRGGAALITVLTLLGSMPIAVFGQAFSWTPSRVAGTAPFTYALTGVLPAWATFAAATGNIAGTPNTVALANLSMTVTDVVPFTSAPLALTLQSVAAVAGAPSITSVTPGNTQASVAFTAPASNGGAAITGYTVTASPGGLTASGAASPIVVPGLTNGTTYTFTVTATNSAGTSALSAASGNVVPSTVPGAPVIGVATVGGNQQGVVAFTAPASNGGSAITGYRATSIPGGIFATGVSSPITVPGLTGGTNYTFTVAAQNGNGYSIESSASNSILASGATFGPLSLYPAAESGIWFDPDDITTYMGPKGTEVVTNGNFSGPTSLFSIHTNATSAIVNGRLELTASSAYGGAVNQFFYVAHQERFHYVEVTLVSGTGRCTFNAIEKEEGFPNTDFTGPYTFKGMVKLRADGYFQMELRTSTAGQTSVWDNITVKPLTNIQATTMFQETAGNTSTILVEQPTGLMLDKRLGLVSGPELIANGTFTTGVNSFSNSNGGGSSAIVGSQLEVTAAAAYTGAETAAAFYAPFVWVYVEATLVSGTGRLTMDSPGNTGLFDNTDRVGPYKYKGFCQLRNDGYVKLVMRTASAGAVTVWDDISLKTVTGNHVIQMNSPARPTLSARKNLLIKTEQFDDNVVWAKGGMTASSASRIVPTATDALHFAGQAIVNWPGNGRCVIEAKADGYSKLALLEGTNSAVSSKIVDLITGVMVTSANENGTTTVQSLPDGWWRITWEFTNVTELANNSIWATVCDPAAVAGYYARFSNWLANGTSAVLVRNVDLCRSSAPLAYQRVNTNTDYDTAGFMHYHKLDGVDDGFSTGTFAAGTLTNNMDCFMLVRRDSSADFVIASQAESGDPYLGYSAATVPASVGAGAPTFAVNGIVVGGTLAAAIPIGQWVVVEARNADLSTWTKFTFGARIGLNFNGAVGERILAPAQTAAKRTEIRQYLVAKAGITL